MEPIRVLLADDDERYLSTLRMFLLAHSDLSIVGAVSDGIKAADAYALLRPDVVVMDVFMPVVDGLDGTRLILSEDPHAHVLLLTGHTEPEIGYRGRAAGAQAFVNKRNAPDELVGAIRRIVAEGRAGHVHVRARDRFGATEGPGRWRESEGGEQEAT